jgi:cytochrome c peroxidase
MGKPYFVLLNALLVIFISCLNSSLWAQVGTASNRSFKMNKGSFIATWDGRIAVYPQPITASEYKWEAYLLKYEALKLNSKSEPDFSDPGFYSNVLVLDGDFGFNHMQNKINVNGRMHLAMVADPDFALNPFPSDSKGAPVSSSKSEFLTYRALIVGQAQESRSFKATRTIPGLFVISTAEFVVKDPETPQATLVSARVLEEGKVIRETATSEPFFGFEPTLSSDGKLLIYAGHPKNSGIHFLMYSFNPNPKNGIGWSKPRHITEMYFQHGPGSLREPLVDGVKFSDKYPIAKKQLRDPFGVPFAAQDGYPGAYPWLSLDNSDLFAATVSTFFAARRSGYAVIGGLTDWTARHIDGAVNISRANVTGRADVWGNTPEGMALEKAYNELTDENGRPYGINAFQRIMISPIVQVPSMWNPFLKSSKVAPLPFSEKPNTFGAILSHSDRYVEISLSESADENLVSFYPMNEALKFNRNYMKIMQQSADVQDWDHVHNMVTYDAASTPDTSGGFQTAKLVGAQFPFEYFDAIGTWKSQRRLVDRTVGIEGNSVFFKPKSFFEATLSENSIRKIKESQEWNASFFIRPYLDLTKESIFLWENHFSVTTDNGKLIVHGKQSDKWVVVANLPSPLSKNEWQHLSLNYRGGKFELRHNSKVIFNLNVVLDLPKSSARLRIGPYNSVNPSLKALYSIDEVAISSVFRTADEVRKLALVRSETGDNGKSTSNSQPEIDLGSKLFHDPILSKDNSISCATCHVPSNSFVDGKAKAIGINGLVGKRNTPTLFNLTSFDSFMWDGRAKTLEVQALLPIASKEEMALPISEAVTKVKAKYDSDFQAVYGASPSALNLGSALAAFQRTLKAPETRFDLGTLDDQEKFGEGLFFGKARCASCHQGQAFTDNRFHNLGFLDSTDQGQREVTKRLSDAMKFRTPGLRAVGQTSPYFHDGRFNTLEEVLDFYNKGGDDPSKRSPEMHPLGLNEEELLAIKAFLMTL